jgi:ribosomal protein S18 acetylase RimI-like enzyme
MSTSSSPLTLETLQFRQATESDAEKVAAFARAVFIDTFSARNTPENMAHYLNAALTNEKILEEILDSENTFVFIEHNQVIIAYYKLTTGFDPADSSIPEQLSEKASIMLERFYVDFAWHGSIVAKQMMQHCLEFAESLNKDCIWLGVWENNFRAQKFYQKWDFDIVGSHPFVMGDETQTDYWMARPL